MRSIIAKRRANLLNVTVRSVSEDPDTFLRYADQPMVAFVMLFVQKRTDVAEKEMETLTRELIDAGRQYLRAGATHLIFTCPQPYSAEGARWLWNEVVTPLRG